MPKSHKLAQLSLFIDKDLFKTQSHLVCQMTTITQIELRMGIYLMRKLKTKSNCKQENNYENVKNNIIKNAQELTNLGEKSAAPVKTRK